MSFQVVLDVNKAFAINSAGEDYTWAFNWSMAEEGDYLMSYSFASGNITLATFATNGPVVMSVDFGIRSFTYLAGATTQATSSSIAGNIRLNWRSTTVATYFAQKDDNFPIVVKDLSKASNFIRVRLETNDGVILPSGPPSWIVILYFEKITDKTVAK